ncbi:metal ABC transporter ATP-binding protein [Peptostreptococcus equinus]|uniref:Metal ABC transporter ATP-binding protein n=1 Tax=Peptostreptococcus equinus TaxID=3003601 RepID=A0ABY7JNC5_9FIRM|nr:metal ABC transporter ATP-binding protein [Peptostreptococcus sp. CBA3647]WAW14878.1 metal ABC transporter ATP-binding protein [Peptostreptococcus sp. CBA3647]
MKKLIEIKNMYFKYDKEYVIENLDLDIYSGDYLGIIGSNGSGKSTLIKLMLGILKPSKGEILLYGKNPAIGKFTSNIGYVSQVGLSTGIDFPATVREIVMMNLYREIGLFKFSKVKHKEMVKKALQTVDMLDYEKSKFSDLSGGQQQRVMIAKAIVNNPELLILDEPTTGIDHKSVESLYSLLDNLHKNKNISIVMISHDIKKIKSHATKILELDDFSEEVIGC